MIVLASKPGGGCSCAGTYGHFLLHVNELTSKAIEQKILEGCLMERPGWVRMSIHPTMTTAEIDFICDAIKQIALNHKEWGKDYTQNLAKNEFEHKEGNLQEQELVRSWFKS